MTEPPSTITSSASTSWNTPDAGSAGALPEFGDAPFAEILSTIEAPSTSGSGADRRVDVAAPRLDESRASTGPADEDPEKKSADKPSAEAERRADSPEQPSTPLSGLPLTIHTLNNLLLRGDLAKPAPSTPESEPSEIARPNRQGNSSASNGEEAASGQSENHGTMSASKATTATQPKEPAPSPLAALTRAGESAQASTSTPKVRNESVPASQGSAPAVDGARATGVLTKLAVASSAPLASSRDLRPGAGNASGPVAGVNTAGGAQGTRPGMRTLRSADAPATPSTNRAREEAFQSQLARGVAAALEKGRGTLTLRLKPEALGQLHIKVSMKDGALNARFEAQTSEARDLLLSTTGDLRRSLEAAGVSVERIEASVAPDLRAQTPDPSNTDLASDGRSSSDSDASPGRDQTGSSPERRGADAPPDLEVDHAAEPHTGGTEWLVLGLDTIA